MTEIIPNLYLGDRTCALDNQHYDMLVNCTIELPNQRNDNSCVRIPVWDRADPNQTDRFISQIISVVKTIDEMLSGGKRVLVYCAAGQSRSATVVACYLLWRDSSLDIDATVRFVKSRDSNAFFSPHLVFRPVMEYVMSKRT